MTVYLEHITLREIDRRMGLPKGSAFRAFKRIEHQFTEGADYRLLRPGEHHQSIENLRVAGRIYPSSMNVVLLTPETAAKVLAELRHPLQ